MYVVDLCTPGLRDRVGQLKGADFAHFYLLGWLANHGLGTLLYGMNAQSTLLPKLIPQSAGLVYIPLYGPQVSLLFAPLARMSYPVALIVWWVFNLLVYAISCYLIWKTCPRLRVHNRTVALVALAFPGFFALIAWGQSSAPALLAFVLAYLAVCHKRNFAAGLALGLLAYKPPLAVASGVLFLLTGEWAIVSGAVLSGAIQIGLGWHHYGTGVMKNYVHALFTIPQNMSYMEPKVYMAHSLRAFWGMLMPTASLTWILYALSSAIVLVITIKLWRSGEAPGMRFSALLLATVLVAPHLTVYDLVILAPAFLLLTEWRLQRSPSESGTLHLLLYLSFALPLLGPVTRYTHLQFSVIAFGALLLWMWKEARDCDKNVSAIEPEHP